MQDAQLPEMPAGSDAFQWAIYIVGALVSALVWMWKLNESKNSKALEEQKQTIQRLEDRIDRVDASRDECEKDRQRLYGVCGELTRRLEALEKK